MIRPDNKLDNTIMAETAEQELWELNGKVKALIEFVKRRPKVDREDILDILGYEEYEEVEG